MPLKDQFQKTFEQVAATLRETLTDLSESARRKTIAVVESWILVFPELESMGLEITSFGATLGISPAVEVELTGPGEIFADGRLETLRETYRSNVQVSMVLRVVDATRQMYDKLGKDTGEQIFLNIKVKVPPQISVYFGKPTILA